MSRFSVSWTLLLWIPGSALFGVGWVLDGNGWTTEHGFVTNVLAAATSGLLGLPVAAIIVQWILRRDAESRRRRDIVRAARRNFADMRLSLEALGIDKVQRLKDPVMAAGLHISGLHFAVSYSRGIAPGQMVNEAVSSLSSLSPIISENLPNLAEDEWNFSSALRRWEVMNYNVFSSGEVDGIRVIADEDYAKISSNIGVVANEGVEWLPNLMREADALAATLGGPYDDHETVRIHAPVGVLIGELNNTLSRLDRQLAARVDLHTDLVAASKFVDSLSIE